MRYHDYQKAIEEYHAGQRTICPIQSQFMFMTKDFEIKKYGYVQVYETGGHWFRTKHEAVVHLKSGDIIRVGRKAIKIK